MNGNLLDLIEAAREAAGWAYAPYSHFYVGAALRGPRGRVWTGCNVENASYGLTICAERVALFRAVADGARDFEALAIFTHTRTPTPPCGACRQALAEFGLDLAILSGCDGPERIETTLRELLPGAFVLEQGEGGVR